MRALLFYPVPYFCTKYPNLAPALPFPKQSRINLKHTKLQSTQH